MAILQPPKRINHKYIVLFYELGEYRLVFPKTKEREEHSYELGDSIASVRYLQGALDVKDLAEELVDMAYNFRTAVLLQYESRVVQILPKDSITETELLFKNIKNNDVNSSDNSIVVV